MTGLSAMSLLPGGMAEIESLAANDQRWSAALMWRSLRAWLRPQPQFQRSLRS